MRVTLKTFCQVTLKIKFVRKNSRVGSFGAGICCFNFSITELVFFPVVLKNNLLYNRTNDIHFLSFIFNNILYMFRIDRLFIIRR